MSGDLTYQTDFDVIFAGFGASACLTLLELDRTGWLAGKRVAIIDPDRKDRNDRTFCFWASADSTIVNRLSAIISKTWNKIDFNGKVQDITPWQYFHIRGIDLYLYTRNILTSHSVSWLQDTAEEITATEHGIRCRGNRGDVQGTWCFDSRPLPGWQPQEPEVALLQSFYGWRVRLTGSSTDAEAATMMDFDVDQHNSTQFMYRLPFSPNEMLVELTRFGKDVIDTDYGQNILAEYLSERFGTYEIIEIETGVIPMEHGRSYPKSVSTNHIITGTRAGLVKPSTGYAFRNMFASAQACAASLTASCEQTPKSSTGSRFRFYDHLLLLILKWWPSRGRDVFNRLISAVPAKEILTFLDERSGIRQEARIFSKLPIGLFLRALVRREFLLWRNMKSEVTLLAGTLAAVVLNLFFPIAAAWIIYSILIAGLVLIGLPHGALDDVLDGNTAKRRIDPIFILKYVLQGAAMLLTWWWSPATALWIFLIYSAWHFGQADQEEVSSGLRTTKTQRLMLSFFRGAIVLSVILLSHTTELNSIMKELNVPPVAEYWSTSVWPLLAAGFSLSLLLRERKTLIGMLTLAGSIWLPLLAAFGIYFIFQHSWRGWHHIRARLGKTNRELFRMALPFHAGAWLLLALLYILNPAPSGDAFGFGRIGLFFVFLSSLSFPHVLAMHRFYGTAE